MSTSAQKVQTPADPDPTPIQSADPTPEVQGAARSAKKRIASSYGRQNTILAGNSANNNNQNKKTVLGG